MREKHPQTDAILALRGQKSLGLIAKQFNVGKGVVSGIFFKADHPGQNRTGTGFRMGPRAKQVEVSGSKPGRQYKRQVTMTLEEIARICRSEMPSEFAIGRIRDLAERAATNAADKREAKRRKREAARNAAMEVQP